MELNGGKKEGKKCFVQDFIILLYHVLCLGGISIFVQAYDTWRCKRSKDLQKQLPIQCRGSIARAFHTLVYA